ncbi:C3a anaphylatoxin chemotactic receptor-like [Anomaloglossus baeobatrachus]|uniref:C3a anaphylatoxin chemotactic receptor-like n=1 Tax=Anomaloglossus baeobatrachus TaxID=238106 RepID=UPI003F500591
MLVIDKGSTDFLGANRRDPRAPGGEGRLRDIMDFANLNMTLQDIMLNYNNQLSYKYETRNTTISHDYVDIIQKVSITLYSIIFLLGTTGNGLVIWIAGFRMKKTISAMWFLNLAIADFLCCTSIPLRIAEWVFPFLDSIVICCILTISLFNLNMSASVFFLTAMSIDRWVSVMWPFWAKVHRTRKLVIITAVIIWGLSLIVIGLVGVSFSLYSSDLNEWCLYFSNTNVDRREVRQTVRLNRLLTMFVIPFFIIVTSYVTIFFKLRKRKRSQRSYGIISAVILCFFICCFPFYIWPLTPMYNGDFIHFHIVNTIVANLVYLNSCINPIIYVFMSHDFQHGFLKSIPARLERTLGE